MSKVKSATFVCPECGWTMKTPFGKTDLQEHIKLHNKVHHGSNQIAKMTKTELIDKIAVPTKLVKK